MRVQWGGVAVSKDGLIITAAPSFVPMISEDREEHPAQGEAAPWLSLTGDVTGSISQCQLPCTHEHHISFCFHCMLHFKNDSR